MGKSLLSRRTKVGLRQSLDQLEQQRKVAIDEVVAQMGPNADGDPDVLEAIQVAAEAQLALSEVHLRLATHRRDSKRHNVAPPGPSWQELEELEQKAAARRAEALEALWCAKERVNALSLRQNRLLNILDRLKDDMDDLRQELAGRSRREE